MSITAISDVGQEVVGQWVYSPWLNGRPYEISQGYGDTAYEGEPQKGAAHPHWHEGLDLEVPAGTIVHLPDLGRLTQQHNTAAIAHRGIWNGKKYAPDPEGYGPYAMTIEMGPLDIILGHGVMAYPQDGAALRPGTPLIATGSEGNSTGPHLHVGVRHHRGEFGTDLDPWAIVLGQTLPDTPPRGGPATKTGLKPTDVPSWGPPGSPTAMPSLAQGGPAMGLGAGSCPTSGTGGECLAFVAQCSGKLTGIPAAKDAATNCNTNTPKKGDVFITTEAPFGHAGFIYDDAATQVLDSNYNLDHMINIHPLSDIKALGPVCYIDLGQPFGGANPQGGDSSGSSANPFDAVGKEIQKAEETAVNFAKGAAQVGLGALMLAGAGYLILQYTKRGRSLQQGVRRPLRSGRRLVRGGRRGRARGPARPTPAGARRAQGGRAAPAGAVQGAQEMRRRGYVEATRSQMPGYTGVAEGRMREEQFRRASTRQRSSRGGVNPLGPDEARRVEARAEAARSRATTMTEEIPF